jgi:hypothetical protein
MMFSLGSGFLDTAGLVGLGGEFLGGIKAVVKGQGPGTDDDLAESILVDEAGLDEVE